MKRTTENFTCENCQTKVKGNGYTNHCPACLWSKHVDIEPGDRASQCQSLMQPNQLETIQDKHIITHYCTKCRHKKRNKTSPQDNFETLLTIKNQT